MTRLGGHPASIIDGLSAMKDTFVRFVALDREGWTFKHPTIADAFAALMADDPEFVDLYLAGASLERVLDEVTAGPVALENVKVVVPRSRFDRMITRLQEYKAQAEPADQLWYRRRRYFEFLATRCSRDFLARYIVATPDFWRGALSIGSFLSASPELSLIKTLHDYGLLPPEHRAVVLEQVRALAVVTPDADFLRVDRIRSFFTETEISEIMNAVLDELLPDIDVTIDNWRDNYDRSDDAEAHFGSLIEAFDAFREASNGNDDAQKTLSRAIEEVETIISEYETEPEREDRDDDEPWFPSSRPVPAKRGDPMVALRPMYDDLDD